LIQPPPTGEKKKGEKGERKKGKKESHANVQIGLSLIEPVVGPVKSEGGGEKRGRKEKKKTWNFKLPYIRPFTRSGFYFSPGWKKQGKNPF